MSSANFSKGGDGTTSSPSHLDNRDSHIQQIQPFEKSRASSKREAMVTSSSGQSYTLTELCTCTDYSRPKPYQMSLPLGLLRKSGVTFSLNSGDPRCVRCNLVRPYRITYLSM